MLAPQRAQPLPEIYIQLQKHQQLKGYRNTTPPPIDIPVSNPAGSVVGQDNSRKEVNEVQTTLEGLLSRN